MKIYSNKGFTVVEMLVSMALVGVISALGFVNYTEQIPRYELREAGRDLTAQLRLLRQRAITEGGTRRMIFRLEDGAYFLQGAEDDQGLPTHVKFGLPEGVPLRHNGEFMDEDEEGEDATTFPGKIAGFNADGLPSSLGTLHMTNAPFRDEALAITVSRTGRVRLFNWDGNAWEQ